MYCGSMALLALQLLSVGLLLPHHRQWAVKVATVLTTGYAVTAYKLTAAVRKGSEDDFGPRHRQKFLSLPFVIPCQKPSRGDQLARHLRV